MREANKSSRFEKCGKVFKIMELWGHQKQIKQIVSIFLQCVLSPCSSALMKYKRLGPSHLIQNYGRFLNPFVLYQAVSVSHLFLKLKCLVACPWVSVVSVSLSQLCLQMEGKLNCIPGRCIFLFFLMIIRSGGSGERIQRLRQHFLCSPFQSILDIRFTMSSFVFYLMDF